MKIEVDIDEIIKGCLEVEDKYTHEPTFVFVDVLNDLYGIEEKVYSEVSKQIGDWFQHN